MGKKVDWAQEGGEFGSTSIQQILIPPPLRALFTLMSQFQTWADVLLEQVKADPVRLAWGFPWVTNIPYCPI